MCGCMPPPCAMQDYVVCVLCGPGSVPLMDATVADSWGLFDASGGDWLRDAIAACGVPTHLLPRIVPHDRVAGVVAAGGQ
jgi:sugar (pentulose or hexulose) kinase